MVEVSKGFNWGVVIGGGVALVGGVTVALAVKEDQVRARLM